MTPEEEGKKIKEEMAKREQPDSVELTRGTPSKGTAVTLKCYVDLNTVELKEENPEGIAELKIKKFIKAWKYLLQQGGGME